jgi:transcription-repair coupling factor (superfamily II helicase)
VDRRAANPTEKLADFIHGFISSGGRVLLLAESLGRRELVFDYLRQYDLRPVACDDYAEFMASDQPFMLAVQLLNVNRSYGSGRSWVIIIDEILISIL